MTRLLDDPVEAAARAALLDRPAIAALEPVRRAAAAHGAAPFFDPLDGGADARLLLLLETPGPRAAAGFVSMDNRTVTGRNLRRLLGKAGIARGDLVIWNAVPWVIHGPDARNRAVRAGELRAGLALLPALLGRLPRLAVVVLAGRPAAAAEPIVRAARPGMPVLTMPHPSPTIVCTNPAVAARIGAMLAAAAGVLAG